MERNRDRLKILQDCVNKNTLFPNDVPEQTWNARANNNLVIVTFRGRGLQKGGCISEANKQLASREHHK